MLRAAFDASMDSGSGVTAVAGYVGRMADWERLEEKWQHILDRYGLDRYRMVDVFQRYRFDAAVECTSEFAGLINGNHGLHSAGAHMLDSDWSSMPKEAAYRAIYPERQHACLDMALGIAAQVIKYDFNDEPVSVIFDNDYGNIDRAARVYENWRAVTGHPGFHSVAFIKGTEEWDVLPLQCADLYAGLLRRSPYSRASLNRMESGPVGGGADLPPMERALFRAISKAKLI